MPRKLRPEQVQITFDQDKRFNPLAILTTDLEIRPVTRYDIKHYCDLFADHNVMAKYATGREITEKEQDRARRETLIARIHGWESRWENDDPFNGLAIFERKTGQFVGHVVAGRSDMRGVSEVAYLLHREFWGKGYGTQAVSAVVNHFIPRVVMRGCLLDGCQLKALVATTRTDHIPSQRILKTVGMWADISKINKKFGAQRYIFEVSAKSLINNYNRDRTPKHEQRKFFGLHYWPSEHDMANSTFGQSAVIRAIRAKR